MKIAEIRAKFPEATLIAGNVATAEGTRALYDAGVDAVKVGIGLVQFVQLESLRCWCSSINCCL